MLRDLHTHSTASDGTLAPADLVMAAADGGVGQLALTDHDTTSGLAEAAAAARGRLQLVNGVEISVTWQKHLLHVLGLGIDPASETLVEGLNDLQHRRRARAREISDRLARHGLAGAGPGARRLAGGREPGRTHFARWLVAEGAARNVQAAFKRWLKPGRPGHVSTCWADLEAACAWINAAGGLAVLAHPARYRLTRSRMAVLLGTFREAGGGGLEVVRAGADPAEIRQLGEWARRFDLAGSAGSDFHEPGRVWQRLGRLAKLPARVRPVWHHLDAVSADQKDP